MYLIYFVQEGYPVYECNPMCRCSKSCQNRVLQNGLRVKLEIFKTEKKVVTLSFLWGFIILFKTLDWKIFMGFPSSRL